MFLQGSTALYAGLGLWQKNSSLMAPAVVSLDPATGSVVWTTVLGQGDRARPVSHWSTSYITALSLVESFIVMLRQFSYAIKNQLKAPKTPDMGRNTLIGRYFLPFAGSLWHNGGCHARKESMQCNESLDMSP